MSGRRRAARAAERSGGARGVWKALAGLAVLLVLAAAGFVLQRGAGHRAPPVAPRAAGRTQRTLLVGLEAASGPAVEAALLGEDPVGRTGSILLLPGPVLAGAPGYGATTVGASFALPDPRAAAATVSDLLGVRVDGTWRIGPAALAALVDAVGGVSADVDVPDPAAGLATAGQQHLSGAQAAAFAAFLAPGEPEAARPPRFGSVLSGLVAALPRTGPAVGRLLQRLGAGSRSGETPAALGGFLAGLATSSYQGNQDVLPTLTVDTGGSRPALRIDPAAAHRIVLATLSASIPAAQAGGADRVFVENDTRNPAAVGDARAELDAGGLDFVGSAARTPVGAFARTTVVIFSSSVAERELAARVAAALRLPGAPVEVSTQVTSLADAVVILGKDYRG